MNTYKDTVQRLPGEGTEIPYAILPLNSPINILRQSKAKITTNPFIKPIDTEQFEEVKEQKKHKNIPFAEINENLSLNFIGFIDDIFNKPDDDNWINYLTIILNKDDRYTYFAIFLFLIALIIIYFS
jgi:hypothetical protein